MLAQWQKKKQKKTQLCFTHSVNHFYKYMRITLKDFHMSEY